MADDIHGSRAEHVVVLVGQGLRRSDDDRVPSMYAKGVEVFHIADCDTVVLRISDDFIFNLFPALHTSFDENLGARSKGFVAEIKQLFLVGGESTS